MAVVKSIKFFEIPIQQYIEEGLEDCVPTVKFQFKAGDGIPAAKNWKTVKENNEEFYKAYIINPAWDPKAQNNEKPWIKARILAKEVIHIDNMDVSAIENYSKMLKEGTKVYLNPIAKYKLAKCFKELRKANTLKPSVYNVFRGMDPTSSENKSIRLLNEIEKILGAEGMK